MYNYSVEDPLSKAERVKSMTVQRWSRAIENKKSNYDLR